MAKKNHQTQISCSFLALHDFSKREKKNDFNFTIPDYFFYYVGFYAVVSPKLVI